MDISEQLCAGATLGRYELLAPIAQGGMAIVWAARMKGTRGFQKIVAVKSMLPSLSSDEQFEEMFLAEARLASRIRHPNVCEILDLGDDDGNLYIVMEWVDGEALSAVNRAARRQKRSMPFSIIARVLKDAAYGLHAAHELKDDLGEHLGLVHRDVSPQNILVTYDGVVKIVDFGVAKAKGLADGLTRLGQIKGKVPYMAPEQVHGLALDRRADIFSLGVVLYQLLTGRHPFRAPSEVETMQAIANENPPPPRAIVHECPPELDSAAMRALEKNADHRFQTMADFAQSMEKAIGQMAAAGEEHNPGVFMRDVIGERGDKRRAAIKAAIRSSEERSSRAEGGSDSGRGQTDWMRATGNSQLTIPLALELTPAPDSVVGLGVQPPPTDASALLVRSRKRPRTMAIAGVVAIAAIVGAVGLVMPRPGGSTQLGSEALSEPNALSTLNPSTEMAVAPALPSSAPDDPATSATTAEPTSSAMPSATLSATAKKPPPRTRPWRPKSTPTTKQTGIPKIRTPGF